VDIAVSEMERWSSLRTVEVSGIPAGTRKSTLLMLLESQRLTGITGVTVDAVEFSTEDHSHALVTLSTAEGLFACFLNSLGFLFHVYMAEYDMPVTFM